ncbi:Uncharacterised protein [BD1-7 clade bacterium]|uniref:Uncharacterized protein n=1 Tax=BD1-7 clade bacterium TaxID=2029982 RepID=A0A5S9NXK4_9GAMM|nr:Uncharacterised protein [BD1-7 clade bacterium]CAA0095496.1 Uncharacterised protein [BD1-7 clade bacterium]
MRLLSLPDDLTRIECVTNDEMNERLVDMTHAVYPHRRRFGDVFTLERLLPVSADAAFALLANTDHLHLWNYAARSVASDDDLLIDHYSDTPMRLQLNAYPAVGVIDMHWRIADSKQQQAVYFSDSLRIVNARHPLHTDGCVLLWTCTPGRILAHAGAAAEAKEPAIDWRLMPARRQLEINNIERLLNVEIDAPATVDAEVVV